MSDINQLYSVLFDTLKDLRDPEKKIDTARVKLINDTAKNIIDTAKTEVDTAKTEVDCMRVTGTRGSGFLPAPMNPAAGGQPTLVPAPPIQEGVGSQLIAANVHRHELK